MTKRKDIRDVFSIDNHDIMAEDTPTQHSSPPNEANDADADAMEEELDPEIDIAIDPAPPDPENADGGEDENMIEPREPAKKDIALRDFLAKMDDFAPIVRPRPSPMPSPPPIQAFLIPLTSPPINPLTHPSSLPQIPDAVTQHHLLLAGLSPTTTPLPLTRLLALATQKFIADIAADAYQYSRMRSSNTGPAVSTGLPGAAVPGGEQQSKGKEEKGKSGAHVLGVQRAGYGGGGVGGAQSGRAVLTMEDLGCAVGEYGVNVKRGEFYR